VEFGSDFRKTLTSPKSQRVAIFCSPSPQGDEDEELYEKNAEMKEVDGVIISSIHRITASPANSSNAVARNQMLEINCSKMKLLDCNFSRNTSSSNCNFSKMFCSNLYGRKCVIGV
jgi:hypothetical protein